MSNPAITINEEQLREVIKKALATCKRKAERNGTPGLINLLKYLPAEVVSESFNIESTDKEVEVLFVHKTGNKEWIGTVKRKEPHI